MPSVLSGKVRLRREKAISETAPEPHTLLSPKDALQITLEDRLEIVWDSRDISAKCDFFHLFHRSVALPASALGVEREAPQGSRGALQACMS